MGASEFFSDHVNTIAAILILGVIVFYLGIGKSLASGFDAWWAVNASQAGWWAAAALLGFILYYIYYREKQYVRTKIPFNKALDALAVSDDPHENYIYHDIKDNYNLVAPICNRAADKAPTWFGFFKLKPPTVLRPRLGKPPEMLLALNALWQPIPAGTRFLAWAPPETLTAWCRAYNLTDLSYALNGWPEDAAERAISRRIESGDVPDEFLPLFTGGSGGMTKQNKLPGV